MAFLKIVLGACPGQIVELNADRLVLGRHPNCEIVLDSAAVSRYHAQILQTHGSFFLEDLRSRNRTYLNDIAVQGRTELHDTDMIKICDVVFQFYSRLPIDGNSSSSWLLSGSKIGSAADSDRKMDGDEQELDTSTPSQDVDMQPEDSNDSSTNSSIITTINAKTESHLRLEVKPDVKLRAVLEIGRALAQTLNLRDVLKKTLNELFKIYPQAEEGFILLKDEATGKLRIHAVKKRSGTDKDSVKISRTIIEQAMKDCEAILSQDALEDDRFTKSDSISKFRIRSMMCVPLVDIDGDSIGVIQLDTRDLREQFSEDDLEVLVSVASQILLAVDNARLHQQLLHQHEMEKDQERKASEMDLAVQVQLDFLPNSPPTVEGYDFYDFYEAAMEVGGDYFDYIELPDKRIVIPLGDVAGKGVPAALLMAKLSSSARYQFLSKSDISTALETLNTEISSGGLGHRFITLSLVIINPKTHEVTVANAGHPPVLLRHLDGTVEELGHDVAATPLGVVRHQRYPTESFTIEEGETILLYSDGIIDAMNGKDEVFGRKRLREYLAGASGSVKEIADGLLREIEQYSADQPDQTDDISLVCIQRNRREP